MTFKHTLSFLFVPPRSIDENVFTMTKLFVTGATGFIGGDAFYAIANAHPEYEITALVRNSEKGAQVAKEYPSVKLVYGDLDSTDLLEEEAKKADIVCRTSLLPMMFLNNCR